MLPSRSPRRSDD